MFPERGFLGTGIGIMQHDISTYIREAGVARALTDTPRGHQDIVKTPCCGYKSEGKSKRCPARREREARGGNISCAYKYYSAQSMPGSCSVPSVLMSATWCGQ